MLYDFVDDREEMAQQEVLSSFFRGVRVITLDATNTILRVKGSVGERYANAGHQHGIEGVDASNLDKGFGLAWKSTWQEYPNFGRSQSMPAHRWWEMIVLKSFECSGCKATPVQLRPVFEQLYSEFNGGDAWLAYEDVQPALEALRDSGIRLAVISNFHHVLSDILDDLKLTKYFEKVFMSGELDYCKPDTRIFQHCLQALGVDDASTVAHIGDDWEKDVEACRKLGMRPVHLDRKRIAANVGLDINKRTAAAPGVSTGVLRLSSLSDLMECLQYNNTSPR
eukprot:scpid79097/ scgid13149/ Haloacid dehalogenase-like hydrolase domain-containing protein 3